MRYAAIILVLVFIWACPAPAQVEVYDIAWNLNRDGITYEYMLFLAWTTDSTQLPFNDSLFTFPDSQWQQFLIGSYSHDSLFAIDTNRAVIEYDTQRDPSDPDAPTEYIGVCVFAKSPQGFYAERSTSGPVMVPPYLTPTKVAGITITRRLKWK